MLGLSMIGQILCIACASAVFPIFYDITFPKGAPVTVFGAEMKSTAVMSFTTALAFLIVAFISPFLSGIADYSGKKKNFLKAFCYIGSLSCVGLYWFSKENL
jgi:UMF1 family MFS transporter